mgnify:CR=1 FL=1
MRRTGGGIVLAVIVALTFAPVTLWTKASAVVTRNGRGPRGGTKNAAQDRQANPTDSAQGGLIRELGRVRNAKGVGSVSELFRVISAQTSMKAGGVRGEARRSTNAARGQHDDSPPPPPLPVCVLSHGCWGGKDLHTQKATAKLLARVHTVLEVGSGVRVAAVIAAGDNFYTKGVASVRDPRFNSTFEDVYADDDDRLIAEGAGGLRAPAGPPRRRSFTQVPWLLALGNHDYRGNVSAQLAYTSTRHAFFASSAVLGNGGTFSPPLESSPLATAPLEPISGKHHRWFLPARYYAWWDEPPPLPRRERRPAEDGFALDRQADRVPPAPLLGVVVLDCPLLERCHIHGTQNRGKCVDGGAQVSHFMPAARALFHRRGVKGRLVVCHFPLHANGPHVNHPFLQTAIGAAFFNSSSATPSAPPFSPSTDVGVHGGRSGGGGSAPVNQRGQEKAASLPAFSPASTIPMFHQYINADNHYMQVSEVPLTRPSPPDAAAATVIRRRGALFINSGGGAGYKPHLPSHKGYAVSPFNIYERLGPAGGVFAHCSVPTPGSHGTGGGLLVTLGLPTNQPSSGEAAASAAMRGVDAWFDFLAVQPWETSDAADGAEGGGGTYDEDEPTAMTWSSSASGMRGDDERPPHSVPGASADTLNRVSTKDSRPPPVPVPKDLLVPAVTVALVALCLLLLAKVCRRWQHPLHRSSPTVVAPRKS